MITEATEVERVAALKRGIQGEPKRVQLEALGEMGYEPERVLPSWVNGQELEKAVAGGSMDDVHAALFRWVPPCAEVRAMGRFLSSVPYALGRGRGQRPRRAWFTSDRDVEALMDAVAAIGWNLEDMAERMPL